MSVLENEKSVLKRGFEITEGEAAQIMLCGNYKITNYWSTVSEAAQISRRNSRDIWCGELVITFHPHRGK